MAVGRIADYPSQVPTYWQTELYAQAENLTFWQKFEGPEGASVPIIRKDDLEKQPGDTIKYDIALALTGSGSVGDTSLTEGAEEKAVFRQTSMTVAGLKHGVRWSWLSKVEVTHDMRTVALNQLKKWLAGRIDNRLFAEFTGVTIDGFAPSVAEASLPASMKLFAGSATSIATVDNTDAAGRLKLNDISDIKALAQATNKVEPLRLDGGDEIFGLVIHPFTALALKKDSSYQQAQREAQARGADNPLFKGSVAMWDGVVIFVSNRVPTAADGVGAISVSRNILFGAQALCRGYAMYPGWFEQDFSYGEEAGVATRTVLGQKLNLFDLTVGGTGPLSAIGSMILYSAAVAPAV